MKSARTTRAIATPARGGPAPSACEMVADLAAGRATAVAQTEAHLERISALEPDVLAWATLDHEGAMDRARQLDAAVPRRTGVELIRTLPIREGSVRTMDRPGEPPNV